MNKFSFPFKYDSNSILIDVDEYLIKKLFIFPYQQLISYNIILNMNNTYNTPWPYL